MSMIVGNKIYERCMDCGQLVQVNKWLFGSLHVCHGERSAARAWSRQDRKDAEKREKARATIRKALRILKLPRGVDNDESCCDDECGVQLGKWHLCYAELDYRNPMELGVFMFDEEDGEHDYGSPGLPSSRALSRWLRKVLDKHDLWEEFR